MRKITEPEAALLRLGNSFDLITESYRQLMAAGEAFASIMNQLAPVFDELIREEKERRQRFLITEGWNGGGRIRIMNVALLCLTCAPEYLVGPVDVSQTPTGPFL